MKSNETNLGPDFWNLRQHRRAHFVELDLLPIAKRNKTGTGEDSHFGDSYWACSRRVYRWTLLDSARRWHKCGRFNNSVSERIGRGHTIQQVVQTGKHILFISQLSLNDKKNITLSSTRFCSWQHTVEHKNLSLYNDKSISCEIKVKTTPESNPNWIFVTVFFLFLFFDYTR